MARTLGSLIAVLVCAAALQADGSHAVPAAPYHFSPYGWNGRITYAYTLHTTIPHQVDAEAQEHFVVHPDGTAHVFGSYHAITVDTYSIVCVEGLSAHGASVTHRTEILGSVETTVKGVHVDLPDLQDGFDLQKQRASVTETETSADCPTFAPTHKTGQIDEDIPDLPGRAKVKPEDPEVPALKGSYTFKRGQETATVTYDLKGCGEQLGVQWVNRFQPDNRLSALKEPFQQDVRDFIAALRAAGAKVAIIQVYRPAPRAYLMHHSWRIAYGDPSGQYAKEDPEKVPAFSGEEKVPICWTFRNDDGTYSKAKSIEEAGQMAQQYGIFLEHGAAYPSNHSGRIALDMNISWSGTLKIKEGRKAPFQGATVEIHQGQPYWIDKQTHEVKYVTDTNHPPSTAKVRYDQDMNQPLWAVGRSYGVVKYAKPTRPDPPHWSANGG